MDGSLDRFRGTAVCVLVALVGCGRVSFDAIGAGVDTGLDGSLTGTDGNGSGDAAAMLDETSCDELQDLEFCDSYEGAQQLTTVEVTPPGILQATTDQAYRGLRSLHSRTTGGIEAAWELGTVLPNVVSGDVYARWYQYLPSTNPAQVDLAGIHIIEQVAPNGAVSFEIEGNLAGFEVTTNTPLVRAFSTTVFPRDRWVCVQLRITVSDNAGAVELALDGTMVVQRTGLDTRPAAGFANVHAGMFATSPATVMRELYTDELALALTPIPCD